MKSYRELVQECPELGEVFAEFENRISYLENRHIPTVEEPEIQKRKYIPSPQVTYNVIETDTPRFKVLSERVQKLEARLHMYFENKINKKIADEQDTNRYNKYT